MNRRQAIGIGVAVAITLVVVGAVWWFGIIATPAFASLADRPDKSIPGTVVFVHHDDGEGRSCVQSTPAGGGRILEIVCRPDGRGLQLEADSEGRLLVRTGAYPPQGATAYEPPSGAVLERNVVIDGAGARDTVPGDRATPVAPRPDHGSDLAADGSVVEVSGCGGDQPGVEITGRDAQGGEVTSCRSAHRATTASTASHRHPLGRGSPSSTPTTGSSSAHPTAPAFASSPAASVRLYREASRRRANARSSRETPCRTRGSPAATRAAGDPLPGRTSWRLELVGEMLRGGRGECVSRAGHVVHGVPQQ